MSMVNQRMISSLLTLLVYSLVTVSRSAADQQYQYVVQEEPIVFLKHPLSRTVQEGTALRLSCQARIKPIINDIYQPVIDWKRNGITVSNSSRVQVVRDGGISSLFIRNALPSDAGQYHCEAKDGSRITFNPIIGTFLTSYMYITTSHRSCVSISGIFKETVKSGQPFMLPCGNGTESTHWLHNGSTLSFDQTAEGRVLLSNNSVLVYSAVAADSGLWQCVHGRDASIISSSTITVTFEQYSGPPLVFIDVTSTPTTAEVQCITVPYKDAGIRWDYQSYNSPSANLSSGEEPFNSSSHMFQWNPLHSGVYTCSLIMNNSVIASVSRVIVSAVPPNITTLPSAQDIYKSVSGAGVSVRLECMATGLPHPNIFWLKDGHPIAQHLFNNKSGLLQVTRNDFSDGELLGLYQCFAENSVGVQSATVRVLAEGLGNPPTNLKCSVAEANGKVNFTVSWSPPKITGGLNCPFCYEVRIGSETLQQHEFPNYSISKVLDISLISTDEERVEIVVQVFGPLRGISAVCVINPRFRFIKEPNPITLNFAGNNLTLMWEFHRIRNVDSATKIHVNGSCIYGDKLFKFRNFILILSNNFYNAKAFTDLPNGTVCHFSGSFVVNIPAPYSSLEEKEARDSQHNIPVSTGYITPDTPSRDDMGYLGLSCNSSAVSLLWSVAERFRSSQHSINVTGLCINPVGETKHFTEILAGSYGNITILTDQNHSSLCGVTGVLTLHEDTNTSYSIAPVQCIVGVYSPEFHPPSQQTTSTYQTMVTATSEKQTAYTYQTMVTTTSETEMVTIIAVSASLSVLIVLITVSLLTALFLLMCRRYLTVSYYSRSDYEKESYHITSITIDDTISVKTEDHSLHSCDYYEARISLIGLGDADSIANNSVFVHHKAGERGSVNWDPMSAEEGLAKGNDSGCITDSRHINFTLHCSKRDQTGSSGYGSSYSPDSITGSTYPNFHPDTLPEDDPDNIREQKCFHDCQVKIANKDFQKNRNFSAAEKEVFPPDTSSLSSSCETISSSALETICGHTCQHDNCPSFSIHQCNLPENVTVSCKCECIAEENTSTGEEASSFSSSHCNHRNRCCKFKVDAKGYLRIFKETSV